MDLPVLADQQELTYNDSGTFAQSAGALEYTDCFSAEG